jgi:hypothetical protein
MGRCFLCYTNRNLNMEFVCHAVPTRIAVIAVVLVAFVGLARASTPVCPSTHCLFLPLLGQGQAELLPTATSTATPTPTATLISTATTTTTATATATATATTTAIVMATATGTATATATPTTVSGCTVPNFIGHTKNVAISLWMAAGFVGTLTIVGPGANFTINFQSLSAGSIVVCSTSMSVSN